MDMDELARQGPSVAFSDEDKQNITHLQNIGEY